MSGEHSAISFERSDRFSSSMRMAGASSRLGRPSAGRASSRPHRAAASAGQAAVMHHAIWSAISNELVEVLADDDHGRSARGKVDQRLADDGRRAGIHAPGRLVDDQYLGLAQHLAPDDEFLQIAARKASLPRDRASPCGRRTYRARSTFASLAAVSTMPNEPFRWLRGPSATSFGRASFAARCHGRVVPRERRPHRACAAGLSKVAGGMAIDDHRTGVLRPPLAGEGGEQLILSVAGDTGNAQDFTAF